MEQLAKTHSEPPPAHVARAKTQLAMWLWPMMRPVRQLRKLLSASRTMPWHNRWPVSTLTG